jgi:hypothetical protein
MEAVFAPKAFESTYKPRRSYNPKDVFINFRNMAACRLDDQGSIPDRGSKFSFPRPVTHPAPCPMGTGDEEARGEADRSPPSECMELLCHSLTRLRGAVLN